MILVNEPQVWTVIGVLAAALFGGLTVITQLILRTLSAEIGSLRNELGGEIRSLRTEHSSLRTELQGEIGSLRTEMRSEFGLVRTEIGALRDITEARFEILDRDVQALTRHGFGTAPSQ